MDGNDRTKGSVDLISFGFEKCLGLLDALKGDNKQKTASLHLDDLYPFDDFEDWGRKRVLEFSFDLFKRILWYSKGRENYSVSLMFELKESRKLIKKGSLGEYFIKVPPEIVFFINPIGAIHDLICILPNLGKKEGFFCPKELFWAYQEVPEGFREFLGTFCLYRSWTFEIRPGEKLYERSLTLSWINPSFLKRWGADPQ